MIEVLKLTALSGQRYFSKRHAVLDMMERVPTWKRIERVHMSEQQFRELPESDTAAKVLK